MNNLRVGGNSLSQVDAVAALVRSEAIFRVAATKLTWDTLDDVNGSNFCHDSSVFGVSKWLQNGFCVPSEWYRNVFGIVVRQNGACFIKLVSAKLQREKGESKFFANLWRFELLKSAHFPSVYWGKIFFFVAWEWTDFKVSFDAKMTLLANLTIEARKRPICTLLVTVKKWHFGAEWQKKMTYLCA